MMTSFKVAALGHRQRSPLARPFISAIFLCGLMAPRWLAQADLFTAVVDIERLLNVEKSVAGLMRQYVERVTEKLERLSRVADDIERHSEEAISDPERHLWNPVNAYLLIKRFTVDWERFVRSELLTGDEAEFLDSLSSLTTQFPSSEDLNGAGEALFRLQDTYALAADQIASGNLGGVRDSPHLTAHDCYQLGVIAYNKRDYYHTVLWITEALRIYDREPVKTVDRPTLLDYASYSIYMQGNVRHALALTNEWLLLEPNHERAQSNRNYYRQLIESEQQQLASAQRQAKGDMGQDDYPTTANTVTTQIDYSPRGEPTNIRPSDSYKASDEFVTYERLCRGEETQPYALKNQLTCRFARYHPMFYIRPLKEEIVYHKPRIAIYHDVISNSAIAMVKQLARPRLERSVVYHTGPAGTFTAQNYRISKSAWLSDWEHPLVARISRLGSAVANLTLDTAEQMQVLNYGIGGHYEPHYDFATRTQLSELELQTGTRIATFLCYATNVTAGGATVFPNIGVSLWPELGSCALWYNLLRSGEGDFNTRHAACPVLSGTKWVCNKWFHERGQEFVRQCGDSIYQ